jgi:dienelactone hydrolase
MKAALIFGIVAMAALGGWGWKATQAKHTALPQPKPAEPLCELCVSPGSRASLLLAQPSFIANPAPLTEAAITAALSEKIIGPDLALEEVRVFNETRVPDMPRVRTAAEWQAKAAQMRKDVLDKVIFRGSAAAWRNTPLKIQWGDTLENLPGYRIKKLKFEALPGWWIPALLYEPLNLKGKVPVVMNVNGHARTGKATDGKQLRCINLVKRGMIVLNPEWIGMGQFANRMGHYQMNQLDLCGSSGIAPFYLNMSKGLDVLLAHPNADPKRVAVAGLSGGGWQTIFISSLDERVTLANPVAGYSSFKTRARHGKDLGDSEQTPNDLALYADYTHLTAMLANRAALLTNNAYDACCFTHINFKPGTHNFGVDNRQQLYRFIGDVFYPGVKDFNRNEIPSEKELKTYDELIVPLPKDNHSFNTLALGLIKNLPKPQTGTEAEQRAKLLKIIHAKNYKAKAKEIEGEGGIDSVAHYQFQIGNDWTVPGTVFTPAKPKGTTLLIADAGRKTQTARVKALLADGQRVAAFDPFFFGESKIKSRDYLHVILMHAVGERALGVQSGQITALANWAKNVFGGEVNLNSIGPRLSVAARLAAAQTKAIASLELEYPMKSLKEVITGNKGANHLPEMMCHGLLEHFDLKQIEALK